jgi:hypothetical protein
MTKRPRKKSKRGYLWGVEEPAAGGGGGNESAVDPGPSPEGQSFLGHIQSPKHFPLSKTLLSENYVAQCRQIDLPWYETTHSCLAFVDV